MNRRTWVMVGSLPASLLLAFLAAWSGVWQILAAVAVGEVALVVVLMVVDGTAEVRQGRRFNVWVAEHPNGSPEWQAWRAGAPAPSAALCESCELQPATTGVVVDGQRFRVCAGCVPVPAFRDAGSSAVGVLVLAPVVVGGIVGLAWAVNRLGDLIVPLRIVTCVAVALGVVGLAVLGVATVAVAAGGALYALDKRVERRALAAVTVQAVTADRAPDVLGQVVAGEVVREVTR